MAKYLIQDIIPPNKKQKHGGAKKGEHPGPRGQRGPQHPHAPKEEPKMEEVKEEAHPAIHESLREDPRVAMHEEEEIHHEALQESISPPHETEIHDEPIAPGGTVNYPPNEGSWPYNKAAQDPLPVKREPAFPTYETYAASSGGGHRWLPYIIITAIVLVVGGLLLNFWSGATISVLPKSDNIPMEQSLTAAKEPLNGELQFVVMKVTLSEGIEAAATGEKTVTQKASGKIIVYNKQTVAQRLIKNTRFQSPNGKIYRINESINIPKGVSKGGVITPGSIEVTVYADSPGEEYNSEPVDFTVPGLKGGAIYDKVYARSKGPITGGASGIVKTVSDQDLKQAAENLRVGIETKLRTKARGDLAPSQVSFDPSIIIEVGEAQLSKDQASSADKAVIKQEGVLYMVIFDRFALERAIVKLLVPTYAGEEVHIANLDALTFSMPPLSGGDLWDAKNIAFTLKGTPSLAWVVDKDALVKDLVGTAKEDFNSMLAKYTTIERAKAAIRPLWKSTFPKDPTKIEVKIVDKIPE